MEGIFPDRAEAGRLLGVKLSKYAGAADVIVLGLPRGGVPGFEELAVGAIASGGVRVLNEEVANALPNADVIIEAVTE